MDERIRRLERAAIAGDRSVVPTLLSAYKRSGVANRFFLRKLYEFRVLTLGRSGWQDSDELALRLLGYLGLPGARNALKDLGLPAPFKDLGPDLSKDIGSRALMHMAVAAVVRVAPLWHLSFEPTEDRPRTPEEAVELILEAEQKPQPTQIGLFKSYPGFEEAWSKFEEVENRLDGFSYRFVWSQGSPESLDRLTEEQAGIETSVAIRAVIDGLRMPYHSAPGDYRFAIFHSMQALGFELDASKGRDPRLPGGSGPWGPPYRRQNDFEDRWGLRPSVASLRAARAEIKNVMLEAVLPLLSGGYLP